VPIVSSINASKWAISSLHVPAWADALADAAMAQAITISVSGDMVVSL
jgi:hypothetical protein